MAQQRVHPRMRTRAGMTLIELIVAIAVVGIVAAFTIPGAKRGLVTESIRGARRAVTTQLTRARGAATSRGCRSVLHMTGGANGRIWVTSCAIGGAGVDTIGPVQDLGNRFGVTVATSGDSVIFVPNGLGASPGWILMKFAKGGHSDSLSISPVGWASW
jgi:prepilin-type N-terminal cleavage/methylation domain-containing protein